MLSTRRLAAGAALGGALVLWIIHSPEPASRLAARQSSLEKKLASEEIRIDPAEVLELSYNPAARLKLLDLRDENEYNLFHIAGSRRVGLEALACGDLPPLSRDDRVVVVSNGEGRAAKAWLLLSAAGFEKVYILAGGIHGWLKAFAGPGVFDEGMPKCPFDDCRRYRFDAALGDRHPAADPDPEVLTGRTFPRKIELKTPRKRVSGSCG
jgi:rhodanese-related sulfurtransferase